MELTKQKKEKKEKNGMKIDSFLTLKEKTSN